MSRERVSMLRKLIRQIQKIETQTWWETTKLLLMICGTGSILGLLASLAHFLTVCAFSISIGAFWTLSALTIQHLKNESFISRFRLQVITRVVTLLKDYKRVDTAQFVEVSSDERAIY